MYNSISNLYILFIFFALTVWFRSVFYFMVFIILVYGEFKKIYFRTVRGMSDYKLHLKWVKFLVMSV